MLSNLYEDSGTVTQRLAKADEYFGLLKASHSWQVLAVKTPNLIKIRPHHIISHALQQVSLILKVTDGIVKTNHAPRRLVLQPTYGLPQALRPRLLSLSKPKSLFLL